MHAELRRFATNGLRTPHHRSLAWQAMHAELRRFATHGLRTPHHRSLAWQAMHSELRRFATHGLRPPQHRSLWPKAKAMQLKRRNAGLVSVAMHSVGAFPLSLRRANDVPRLRLLRYSSHSGRAKILRLQEGWWWLLPLRLQRPDLRWFEVAEKPPLQEGGPHIIE
jgi:hypothetical protein